MLYGAIKPHEFNRERVEKNAIDRVAFATRYGHIGLTEALHCESAFLNKYNEALARIVSEENRVKE